MFCRWAFVSDTLLTDTNGACGPLSILREQPARDRTVAAMTATADACDLLSMLVRRQISAVPPPAAQCLKQRCRIGKTIGPSLHQVYAALLIRLLGAQQRKIAGVAALPLPPRQIQGDLGGIRRGRSRLQSLRL